MQQINWSDFEINPLTDTVRKEEISDEVYFSREYSDYISNSRLKLINPLQDGSPQLYKNNQFQGTSSCLQIGTSVHQLFLQKDEFTLVEGLNKPSAKLGQVVEKIRHYRNKGYSILESIQGSANEIGYYVNSLTQKRISSIIGSGIYYYLNSKDFGSQHIVMSNGDTDVVKSCLNSLCSNKQIDKVVNSVDFAGDPISSYNEDALFMDIQVVYKETPIILKLKMKADNWTIDDFDQSVTLNDLKTTGKPLPFFMQDYGSFVHFHYSRQMAMYSWILKNYCIKNFGFNENWTFNSNIIAVETIPPYRSDCYKISNEQIKQGMEELFQLIKRVAYYELYGYDEEVEFI